MLLRIDYEHELTPELGGGQTEEGGAQKDEEYDPLKPGIWESGEGTSNGRGGRSIAHGDGYVSDRADGVGSAERKRVRAEANEGQREGRVAASESPAKSPAKSPSESPSKYAARSPAKSARGAGNTPAPERVSPQKHIVPTTPVYHGPPHPPLPLGDFYVSTQTTHFSHMSHTPFPHISECDSFFRRASAAPARPAAYCSRPLR